MQDATVIYSLYLVLKLLFPHVSNLEFWWNILVKIIVKGLNYKCPLKKGLNNVIL